MLYVFPAVVAACFNVISVAQPAGEMTFCSYEPTHFLPVVPFTDVFPERMQPCPINGPDFGSRTFCC